MGYSNNRKLRLCSITVWQAFPAGKIVRQSCRAFLRYEQGTGGRYCYLTGEPIPTPDKIIGERCPLEWEEDDDGQSRSV